MNYPHHSAEEMKRLEKLWQLLDPEVCMRVKTHNTQTLEDYEPLSSDDVQTFLAESNLRTLAWAREQLENMKKYVRVQAYFTENGISNEYPEQRYYNLALDEAIKSLTPESL